MSRIFVLAAVALGLAACSNHSHPATTKVDYIVDCEAADAGVPTASDESFTRFTEAESAGSVTTDRCRAPELVAPVAGATLDPNTPPTFTFNAAPATCALPAARPVMRASCKVRERTLLGVLRDLFSLEGTAYAHCPAFTGENYLFRVTPVGETTPVYTALLSVTSFQPTETLWHEALEAQRGKMVNVTVARAVFFRGVVMEGPFVSGTPTPFQIER